MANIYKNAMFDLTTTNKTTVYTCPTNRTALIKSIQVTNIHTGTVEVEAFATDASDSDAEHEVAHISLASKTVENSKPDSALFTVTARPARPVKLDAIIYLLCASHKYFYIT